MELLLHGRKTETAQQGERGKHKLLESGGSAIPPGILEAIERHEVAYQFQKISVDTYRKYFELLPQETRDLALVASYVDTMGSWLKDGKPDLANFLALCDSKHNFELLESVEKTLAERGIVGLDRTKVEAFLLALRKQNVCISAEAHRLMERINLECSPTEYDLVLLASNLAELVSASVVTGEEADRIMALVQAGDIKAIGKTFGPRTKQISPALKASEKK